jgi:diaminobutyrate-2-oxoglutarate transaminase
MSQIIENLESNVRSYCRSFPVTFSRAEGSIVSDSRDRSYIDLFAGAGALNYGHNDEDLKDALVSYISRGGIAHSLDLTTEAKEDFLATFQELILEPRSLSYRMLFPGPTGTNSVEAAMKIARKVTGRSDIIAFTNAFHGMTLGSLSLTGNRAKRAGAGIALSGVTRMPFDGYLGANVDTLEYLEAALDDTSSGVELPAAIIVETVQAEGGVNVARTSWLRRLHSIAKRHGALLIVDDIQAGCGRTGKFFSFEDAGIVPDLVCLSKSLSGFGLPFALTLVHPDLDVLSPGEHNGTFRGNNLAFVTGARALRKYWSTNTLELQVREKSRLIAKKLERIAQEFGGHRRGKGLIQGVAFEDPRLAVEASKESFARAVIIETSGAKDEVLKVLPALTIDESLLVEALGRVHLAIAAAAKSLGLPRWQRNHASAAPLLS